MAPNTLIEQNCGGEQKKPQKSQFSKYIIPVPFHFPLIPTWSATSYLEKSGHTIKIIYLVSLFTMRICCSSKKNLNNFDDYFQKIASQEKLHSKKPTSVALNKRLNKICVELHRGVFILASKFLRFTESFAENTKNSFAQPSAISSATVNEWVGCIPITWAITAALMLLNP